MIPCYNAKLCGNARRVTRVTEQVGYWTHFLPQKAGILTSSNVWGGARGGGDVEA